MWLGVSWSDSAAIATFVVVGVGGIYTASKWMRAALRHEIHETTEPKFQALSDQIAQDRGATEALRREVRTHMQSEDFGKDDATQLMNQWGERLSREIGQMQWRDRKPTSEGTG